MIEALRSKPAMTVTGLMSGTSLDGIDAAVVRITGRGVDSIVELIHFHCEPYDAELRERLKKLCSREHSNVIDVCAMNFKLGRLFAQAAVRAAEEAGLSVADIDLISSHGQTIWHIPVDDPADPYLVRSTLQIGDLSVIAKETGIMAVGDFRTGDMAVGGQGAPLVPYADYILFRGKPGGTIAQNIGGIGNCTAVPEGCGPEDVVAFDTGPGNMVIDEAVHLLSAGALTYDADGAWAARGRPDESLLSAMLEHPYFSLPPVKTTGREMFGRSYAQEWLAEAGRRGMAADDMIATFTAFTARSIAQSYRSFLFPRYCSPLGTVIVSGGGARNRTLMAMLSGLLPGQQVTRADEAGIASDAKEAMAFALFGFNYIHGIANNLPTATGAARSTVMGKLALP